jgi:hypothetical protein
MIKVKVKLKQSHYTPGQALSVPGYFKTVGIEGGKVVSPTQPAALPPQEIFLLLISVRG